jgi:hypothetical protein
MRDTLSVFASGTKRRLMIGCISTLVSLPIVACCLALLITLGFPALDSLAAGGNGNTTLWVILGVGLVALVGLIGIPLVVLVVLTLRRARALDAVFTPMGLSGRSYMLTGRHYQGEIGGRQADVYIYRGPTVEIRLQAAVRAKLLVVPKGSLPTSMARVFDRQPVTTGDPALGAYSIYSQDRAWADSLLADLRIGGAIQTLMTLGADWAIFRRVEIQPGEVMLYLYRSRRMFGNSLDLIAAPAWLNALRLLAQVAESQPVSEVTGEVAAEVTAQPGYVSSRQVRQKRSNFLGYAIAFLVFIMPLCFIAIGVIAYLVVTMLE